MDAKIAAPPRPLPAPALAAAYEELREKVLELGKDVANPRPLKSKPAGLETGVTELIVAGALLAIGKDAKGLGGFLELAGGRGVVGVAIGVELQRALPVVLADFVFRGCLGDAKDLVVAALFTHEVTWNTALAPSPESQVAGRAQTACRR